jgi:hypothetical protein
VVFDRRWSPLVTHCHIDSGYFRTDSRPPYAVTDGDPIRPRGAKQVAPEVAPACCPFSAAGTATGDVQLGKLAVPRCAVIPCEKNRGVPRDTVRRRDPA